MQANKPVWPADDCYHACCKGAAKLAARKEVPAPTTTKAIAKEVATKEATKEAAKEAPAKEAAKVAEATAEAKEAKAEEQVPLPPANLQCKTMLP